MYLVYEDNPKRGDFTGMGNMDPNRLYMHHYDKYLFLSLVYRNDPILWRKQRAAVELETCEKKLKYWRDKYGFDQDHIANECMKLKKLWKMEDLAI